MNDSPAQENLGTSDFDPFAGPALSRVVPTTEAQREVWLADQLGREASLAFNESISLRLRGSLDIDLLASALRQLVERHESLRATVSDDGLELLIAEGGDTSLERVDLALLDRNARDTAIEDALSSAVETPFDLARGPLLRSTLLKLAEDDHLLLITAHHIVCDGWSFGVICRDLALLYSAQSPERADAFSDYATQGVAATADADERYWLAQFDGSVPVLDLPADRARPARRAFESKREDVLFDAALIADVKRYAGKRGASLFGVLLAGFGAMLARLTGQSDLVIGVPSAGQSASEMPQLVGHCVNLLPVRLSLDAAMPAVQALADTQSVLFDAFEHHRYTFGTLLKKLQLERDPSRLPLVSVMFNLDQTLDGNTLGFGDLDVEISSNPRHYENFELFVNAVQTVEGLRLETQYNTTLYDAATVRSWLNAYQALLRDLVARPEEPLGSLSVTSEADQAQMEAWNRTTTAYDRHANIASLLRDFAPRNAGDVAFVCGGQTLNYGDLDAQSNRLARHLRAKGAKRQSLIGLHVERGLDMIVAQLAILKSGAAYVPLDPTYPPERLSYMASDAGLSLLVTQSTLRKFAAATTVRLDSDRETIGAQSDSPLTATAEDAQPDDPAYVIYTSGSTGKPKGVVVPHRSVVNFLTSMATRPGLSARDCLLAVTTLSFDIAVLELLLPQMLGAKVVVASRDETLDGIALAAMIEEHRVSVMQATPATWRLLIDTGWQGAGNFKALVGGEALSIELAAQLVKRASEVWNMYGPTETTVWSTCSRVEHPRHGISIGTPIANTSVWILDERRQLCPIGFSGELCIGGDGVTSGYLHRPELTEERFIEDSFARTAEARLYRTGDRGRWRRDGTLEHQGRLDTQVKLRGFRIELGEVESTLAGHPQISQSVVVLREDQPGDVRMVAYVIARTQMPGANDVLAHLRLTLPEYMIPQHIVDLDRIPLLANGKTDRRALPAPTSQEVARTTELVAPRDEVERVVLEAMEQVLNLRGLGVNDDFFLLGGHSLLAARLAVKLGELFDVRLPMRTMFEATTAERLAISVKGLRSAGSTRRAPIEHDEGRRDAPLTLMQERIRFIEELHPGRVVYNTPSAHRLDGPMDVHAFERAFTKLIQRQPVLRTAIVRRDDQWVQRTFDHIDIKLLPFEDLSSLPEAERDLELKRRLERMIDEVIDLSRPPLFRCRLFRLHETSHLFFFMAHHIIWDGWSFDLLYEDMSALYQAETTGSKSLSPLRVTYGDFAEWHQKWLTSDECAAQLDYWRRQLSGAQTLLEAPIDRSRRAGMSGVGGTEWIVVDEPMTARLHAVAREVGATMNMTVLAVYVAMSSRVLGASEFIVGVPVRGRLMAELEPVMGFFNNLLPIRFQVDAKGSFSNLVTDVKRRVLEAFEQQDVPFELVTAALDRSSRSPLTNLYDVLFSFQDVRQRRFDWGGLKHIRVPVHQKGATEDLGLWLVETPAGLRGGVTYNKDVVLTATAQRLRDRYVALLERVASDPDCSLDALLSPLTTELDAVRQWTSAATPYAQCLSLSPDDRVLVIAERPAVAREADAEAAKSAGADVVLAAPGLVRDGDALRDAVERENITVLAADPVTWRALLDAWWTAKAGFKACVDITEMSQPLCDALIRAGCRVFGIYRDPASGNPLAAGEIRADDGIHFGTPLANTSLTIVDNESRAMPPCVTGWIAIDGTRTEDRARWRGNGTLQWIGAASGQICMDGRRHRVADLEEVLAQAGGGKACAVIIRETRPGDRRAFVFTEAAGSSANALIDELVKAAFTAQLVHMPALPRKPDGTIERSALAVDGSSNAGAARAQPATETEKALASIWSELLGIDRIEMTDNFFALGGTSLLAMQATVRMQSKTGRTIHARRYVFESLAQLALAYDSEAMLQPVVEATEPAAPSLFGRIAARLRRAR